jgi:hypothetical protein
MNLPSLKEIEVVEVLDTPQNQIESNTAIEEAEVLSGGEEAQT